MNINLQTELSADVIYTKEKTRFPMSHIALLSRNQLTEISGHLSQLNPQTLIQGQLQLVDRLKEAKFPCEDESSLCEKRTFEQTEPITEELESLKKKVKTDESGSSLSTQEDREHAEKEIKSPGSPFLNKKLNRGKKDACLKSRNPRKTAVKSYRINTETPNCLIRRNFKAINKVSFDDQSQKLVFTVTTETDKKEVCSKVLTREEVIQEDPVALLYFYERHLQFTKSPDFKPEKLKCL